MIDLKNEMERKLKAQDVYRLYVIAADLQKTFGSRVKVIRLHPKNENKKKIYSLTVVFG